MQVKNTKFRYGIIAILLHWLMAILLVALIVEGLYMTRIAISPWKLKLFGWHKEYGMLVLLLVMFRIVWRINNTLPSLESLPHWEKIAARIAHWSFYFFMFALPITGWFLTSSAGLPISFFGLFTIPNIFPANEQWRIYFTEIHKWLSYGLIAVFCIHVGAALKHHLINKDNILRRMV